MSTGTAEVVIPLREACAAVCERCRNSGWAPVFEDGEWWHSAEETPSGVGIPPEPCAADAIRKLDRSRAISGPVEYRCLVCGSEETLVGPPFLCGKCFAARDENGRLRAQEAAG